MMVKPGPGLGYDLSTIDLNRIASFGPHQFWPGWRHDDLRPQTKDVWAFMDDRLPRRFPNPLRVVCDVCRAPLWWSCDFRGHPRDDTKGFMAVHYERAQKSREQFMRPFLEKCTAEFADRGFDENAKVMRDHWSVSMRIWWRTEVHRCPTCYAEPGEPCFWSDESEMPPGAIHFSRYSMQRKGLPQ